MRNGCGRTVLTVPNRFRGMVLEVLTSYPNGLTASGYHVVDFSADCRIHTPKWYADEGCHIVTEVMWLSLLGSYHLSMTNNGLRDCYTLWGQTSLEVKALISLPLFVARVFVSVDIIYAYAGIQ